jgi:3'(2'), 5'-bisphosphate nucleotidase
MGYEVERRVAVEAALAACRLCRSVREGMTARETLAKTDQSPVTVADYGSQAVICRRLLEAFPNDPVVAEETSEELRRPEAADLVDRVAHFVCAEIPGLGRKDILAAIDRGGHTGGPQGRFWVLDPIDGTKGFLRRQQYAVALSLIENGQVVLGVVGCPNMAANPAEPDGPKGCLFVAVRGEGARVQRLDDPTEAAARVAAVEDPARANFCESVEPSHSSHDAAAAVAKRLGTTAPPLRMDSQCKYAAVARGQAAIYLRMPTRRSYSEKIWDHAAGSLLVHEAGGRVTDCLGRPLDFSLGVKLKNNEGIVATNGRLHDLVAAAVRQVLEARG